MKFSPHILFILVALLILISSASVATWVHAQCADMCIEQIGDHSQAPKLHHLSNQIFTKYKKIRPMILRNSGGQSLTRCEGYNFPEGLSVEISEDENTCILRGVPTEAQALTPGFVVATNNQGSSLAKVPILVNALVLLE